MFGSQKLIPLFPLGIFILPGDYTQLHIFEERYKDLIRDTKESNGVFGVLSTNRMNTDNLGSAMRLVEIIKTYPTGEMDVLLKCENIFVLNDFYYKMDGKKYPGGTVKTKYNISNTTASNDLSHQFELLEQKRDTEGVVRKITSKGLLDIANDLELADDEKLKFALLEKKDDQERFLLRHIQMIHKLHEQEAVSRYMGFYLN